MHTSDVEHPVLRLVDVFAGYGEVEVLKGIQCNAPHRSLTCIIGANGAGKSTLLKTIFGLVQPRSGEILYQDREISGLSPLERLRAGITYVPQGRCNFPQMSVDENLQLAAYTRRDKAVRSDIQRVCEEYEILGGKRGELAGSLSGGQQQILEIAMALLLRPQVLLIDEPSLGLSPTMVKEVFSTIRNVANRGVTVLMVEQNARQALALSDYAFVLELGRNWLEGTSQAVLDDPRVRTHYLGL